MTNYMISAKLGHLSMTRVLPDYACIAVCTLLTTVLCSRLEKIIRDLVASGSFLRVEEILEQLCNDYAYAVHQPHARNGGLIGLAAAAIALGTVRSTSCAGSSVTYTHGRRWISPIIYIYQVYISIVLCHAVVLVHSHVISKLAYSVVSSTDTLCCRSYLAIS